MFQRLLQVLGKAPACNKLAFSAQPSSTAVQGSGFGTQVEIQDIAGTKIAASTATVTLSAKSAGTLVTMPVYKLQTSGQPIGTITTPAECARAAQALELPALTDGNGGNGAWSTASDLKGCFASSYPSFNSHATGGWCN